MKRHNILSFTFGALVAVALLAPTSALVLRSDGIEFPDGTLLTTAETRSSYYLSVVEKIGGLAPTACDIGYHMASLWEIRDPSNLRYDTALGATAADSGDGPPSGIYGWVRTGYISHAAPVEGEANCLAWESSEQEAFGTLVRLGEQWNAATGTGTPSVVIAPWDSAVSNCSNDWPVWCAED